MFCVLAYLLQQAHRKRWRLAAGWTEHGSQYSTMRLASIQANSVIVEGAGVEECNGEYKYIGAMTVDRFVPLGRVSSYQRKTEPGKIFTFFV